MTFRELAQLYVSTRVISSQYAAHIIRTSKAFETANGQIPVANISSEHIARFVIEIRRRTGNLNTLANYVTQLKILLNYGHRCGLLAEVPPIPRVPNIRRVPRAWSLDEFKRLYEIANCLPGRIGVQLARIWWPSLIGTAYHTRSRIGALLKVRWQDLDLRTGILVLRAENTKTCKEQIFKLPDYVLRKIEAMKWPERDLVWEWPHCRRYFFNYFRKKILRPAQLEPAAGERFGLFHKIRRTSASLAALHGGIGAAQTLLGHASARITIEHYIDPRIALSGSASLPSLE
jgi:integrase